VFLTSVHLRLLAAQQQPTSAVKGGKPGATAAAGGNPAKEELALESLLEFCREPSLMQVPSSLTSHSPSPVSLTSLSPAAAVADAGPVH